MDPRVDDKESCRGPGPAEAAAATGKASEHKAEQETVQSTDQETDETAALAAAADVDNYPEDDEDYDDDPAIWNLNKMARLNLMTPEWIENAKKMHYEYIFLYNRAYDALENGEIETDSEDDDDGAAAAERTKRLWANVDLSGLNTAGGESRGMYPVAVYPVGLNTEEEEDKDRDAAANTPTDEHVCVSSTAG
jgi:hypothetical protein